MVNDVKFKDIEGLVEDYQNNDFNGFTLMLRDGRQFENLIEDGNPGSINLYSVPDKWINNLEGFDDWLQGKRVGVYIKGNKIGETRIREADLRFGGSNETVRIGKPSSWRNKEGIEAVFPNAPDSLEENLSKSPNLASSLQGVADLYSINEVEFKPVSKKEKAKETASKAKEKVSNLSKEQKLGLGIGIGAGVLSVAASYWVTN